MKEKFTNGKCSHKKCWQLIFELLKKKKYNVIEFQCASKFKSLKRTYKSIKDHNSKSGNNRRTWQRFEIMDNMFSKKVWCRPIALPSSTDQLIKFIYYCSCFFT
ncbi:uncharacterized protein [Mycetomoellerius zeteki]|uniref:uncharacterized protein n=1 Tax=Mycetomoellerius zeteki TaxID=64791 RepID=UPI00084E41A1|nr:PREDICTED: uncharacterized protein LOC108721907 [Trachymyrmex zeteki]